MGAKADLRELLFAAEELAIKEWDSASSEMATLSPSGFDAVTRGNTALDRIAQLGAALIDNERSHGLQLVLETLLRLHRSAEGQLPLNASGPHDLLKAHRWKSVMLRVFALGGYAVYRNQFQVIRDIALQVPEPRYPKQHWSRATVTGLARGGTFQPKTLIAPSVEYISDHPAIARRFRNSKDDAVNALCQFDFLQCVVVVDATSDYTRCYPNFGAYFNERTEPVVASLVTGGPARAVVPNAPDDRVAEIIRTLDKETAAAFFDFAGWHMEAWSDRRILDFLSKYSKSR